MGGVGYAVSARATFFLGAALALPGLLALRAIERPKLRIPDAAAAADPDDAGTQVTASHSVLSLLRDRRLFAFAVCAALFHLSNAGMLPLAAGRVTREAPQQAELIIAACILLPQLVVGGAVAAGRPAGRDAWPAAGDAGRLRGPADTRAAAGDQQRPLAHRAVSRCSTASAVPASG